MIKKGLLVSLALILALVALMPSPAYADEKDRDKDKLVPVSCTLTLAVTDPGIVDLSGFPNVTTTGERSFGKLDCNLKAMDGDFASVHSSKITMDQYGGFNGSLKGTFTLRNNKGKVSTGKMTANISGTIIGQYPPPPATPVAFIHRVTDNGKWEIDGKIEAKGTFAITLDGIVGLPASQGGLAGGGTMVGKAERD